MAKGQSQAVAWIGVALVALLVAGYFGYLPRGQSISPLVTESGTLGATTSSGFCADTDGSSLTVSAVQLGLEGTIPNGAHRVWEITGNTGETKTRADRGTIGDTNSITVASGADIEALFNSNSTQAYKTHVVKNVDCKDPFTLQAKAPRFSTPGNVTVYFSNDRGVVDGTTAIAANEVKTVTLKYCPGTNQFIGNPYVPGGMNTLFCEMNNSMFDNLVVVGAVGSSTPSWFSPAGGANSLVKSYYVPVVAGVAGLSGVSNCNEVRMEVTSDATNNPGAAATGNVTCHFADVDYDVNQDDLSVINGAGMQYNGFQDEDGNNIGMTESINITIPFS